MRILVMRLGTAMTPQPHSNVGHGDEMKGLLTHLMKEHEVFAIGRFGVDPGCPHYHQQYSTSYPNENVEAMHDEYARCLAAAQAHNPDCIVTVIGPSGSTCVPGARARCQAFAANYCAPVAIVWNAMPELKRICILNDPRNIIRLSELQVWPDAVLSQANEDVKYRVFDTHLVRHYRYAKTQNWGLPPLQAGSYPRAGIGILAHSHCDDGRVNKNRDDVWEYILKHCPGATIRGRGWPEGPITDVKDFLQRFEWGPMIPIAEGWVTAKFGQYARYGCVPRPYDAGGFLTYDRDCLMIPKDSPLRWNPADGNDYSSEWLEQAVELTEPDFSVLDDCLSDVDKLPLYDTYGGYEKV